MVEVVWAEKGWEVSPPPDGSPLLANWQNHLPWQRGEAICMMDQERKRQCHGVKYGGGGRQENKPAETKVICDLPSLLWIILTQMQNNKKAGGGNGIYVCGACITMWGVSRPKGNLISSFGIQANGPRTNKQGDSWSMKVHVQITPSADWGAIGW